MHLKHEDVIYFKQSSTLHHVQDRIPDAMPKGEGVGAKLLWMWRCWFELVFVETRKILSPATSNYSSKHEICSAKMVVIYGHSMRRWQGDHILMSIRRSELMLFGYA